jgi:hypothetical protein
MSGVKELQESILYPNAKVVKCTHTHTHTHTRIYHNGLLEQCKTGSIITIKIFGTLHWRPRRERVIADGMQPTK